MHHFCHFVVVVVVIIIIIIIIIIICKLVTSQSPFKDPNKQKSQSANPGLYE